MAFALSPDLTFLLGVAIFWLVLYMLARLLHLSKHGLDVQPGYFMYRSKALNSFLDKAAGKRRTIWLVLSNINLAFSIGLMIYVIYFLASNLVRSIVLLTTHVEIGVVSPIIPVIPVVTIRLYWMPYFAVGVAVIALSHELAHGIIARLEGIPVLSTGVVALLLFFGAFVEPDEKEFEKASILSRLRMLAAGSSTNLITGLLVTLLIAGLFVPAPSGIMIQEITSGSPVDRAGLQQWDVIQAINGKPLYTNTDFYNYLSNVTPNTKLVVTVLHANKVENISIITAKSSSNSSRGVVGVLPSLFPYRKNTLGLDQYTGINIFWALFWIYLFSISVAIFNMLPAYPFDGERVLYYPLIKLVKKRTRELRWTINGFVWALFVLNVAVSLLIFGVFRF
jgi:membrane-associated protease RseP (regulator of RpoE activity)